MIVFNLRVPCKLCRGILDVVNDNRCHLNDSLRVRKAVHERSAKIPLLLRRSALLRRALLRVLILLAEALGQQLAPDLLVRAPRAQRAPAQQRNALARAPERAVVAPARA